MNGKFFRHNYCFLPKDKKELDIIVKIILYFYPSRYYFLNKILKSDEFDFYISLFRWEEDNYHNVYVVRLSSISDFNQLLTLYKKINLVDFIFYFGEINLKPNNLIKANQFLNYYNDQLIIANYQEI